MIPQNDDLVGDWTGLIVHKYGSTPVKIELKVIPEDGSLYGSYSYPNSDPHEEGGDFTAELYGTWLFIKETSNSKVHFHVHIIGKDAPEMMYGAIPSANGKTPHATLTVFPFREEPNNKSPFFGVWQDFFHHKGL